MLPVNMFIRVAIYFYPVWIENFAQIPIFQIIGPSNYCMDFLVAWITFNIDSLVALNTIALVYFLL